ncbi:MAG TPA: MFS transporter [Alphaproteobacteria bacterium]|nr:MFS transporter [Alphaproteobacteria bacterium]
MSVSSQPIGRGATESYNLPFVIAASSVGTLIEWYDFYLYGSLAVFFSTLFFPAGNPTVSLLVSLATFATGFAVRPFGAILFGRLGDLIGRKFTFLLTLILMGLSTFLVGCLPSYNSIGMLAPVILVCLRLVQGLALGGEYGGAATYIAEHAPDGKRGLYTSWIQTTATLGIVMSLLVILFFRLNMGDAEFRAVGWRYPFLLSAVLVVLSIYIRMKLQESPLYARLKAQGKASTAPLKESFTSGKNWGLIIIALLGATAPEGVVWYTGQYYSLFFMQTVLKINYVTVYWIITAALCLGTPFFLVFGHLSDKIGRRNIMTAGFLLAAVTYVPVFSAMKANADNPVILTLLVFYMVILVTMVYGPIAAFLVELFPAKIRYTSLSLPYHIGNGVFGGFVPLVSTSLVAATGNIYMGLAYPILIAAIGVVVSLIWIREPTHKVKIWDEVGGPPIVADQP